MCVCVCALRKSFNVMIMLYKLYKTTTKYFDVKKGSDKIKTLRHKCQQTVNDGLNIPALFPGYLQAPYRYTIPMIMNNGW